MGGDHPLEVVYFVEGSNGQRMPAVQAANLLNGMDVQRAAIILGYRVQGILAQREYLSHIREVKFKESKVMYVTRWSLTLTDQLKALCSDAL